MCGDWDFGYCWLSRVFLLQADGWIEDKLKTATQESFSDVSDLQDKMRKLQKHQAFEAEIMANAGRVKDVKEVSLVMVSLAELKMSER